MTGEWPQLPDIASKTAIYRTSFALIGSVQIAFFFSLILATLPLSIAQAAPLCSQVLQGESKGISDEAITASIQQMAQLKLDLDRAQARGSQEDTSNHYLLNQYPQKYQELVQHLQGRLSEKEIADHIQKEIRSLQKIAEANNLEKVQQKQEFIESLKPLVVKYDLVSKFPKNGPNGSHNTTAHILVSEEQGLYYFDRKSLVRFDLKSGNLETIREFTKTGALMKDNKTLLLFSSGGSLLTYDLKSKLATKPTKIELSPGKTLAKDPQNMLLSRNEKWVLLKGSENGNGNQYSVVEVATGKELLNHEDFPADTADIAFLNEREVAVITMNKDLMSIDINSKAVLRSTKLEAITIEVGEKAPSLLLSEDGRTLTVAYRGGLISLNAENIPQIVAELSEERGFHQIVNARGFERIMFVIDRSSRIKMIDMYTLETLFTLGKTSNGWRQSYTAAQSLDGKQTMVIFRDNSNKHFYDLWEQK